MTTAKIMRSLLQGIVHLTTIITVMVLPPLFYDLTGGSSLGGLTYPLYAVYWSCKIKDERVRFLVTNTLLVLTTVVIVMFTAECKVPSTVFAFYFLAPLIVGMIPTPAILARKSPSLSRKTYLVNVAITLAISALHSLYLLFGLARCGMAGMRW